ncbi:MAG: hypothetical protein AAF226_10420 [Verrucomicrobiota bacterium]
MGIKINGRRFITHTELMWCVGIVGILCCVLFAGASGAIRGPKYGQELSTLHNVKTAIAAYFTEYRKFPVVGEDERVLTEPMLMNQLVGSDSGAPYYSPRDFAFFASSSARKDASGKWVRGIHVNEDGDAWLYDRWGNPYRVILDSDLDNQIIDPFTGESLSLGVLCWSAGPDGKDGTKDDLRTWK